MDDDAKQCVRTCFFHVRKIHQLRQFPDDNAMHTLIRALILSWLDYCNSLYAGCTNPLYIDYREYKMQLPCCCVVHHHVLTLVLSCSSFTGCLQSPVVFNTNYVC